MIALFRQSQCTGIAEERLEFPSQSWPFYSQKTTLKFLTSCMHDVMVFLFTVYVIMTRKLCHKVNCCPLNLFHNKHRLYLLEWDGDT